ncbi:MAG: hypothetical protein J2P17_24460, partial [Mycobacterium sp.]|nr:hypothetical protein [Mycobacterium sp.]
RPTAARWGSVNRGSTSGATQTPRAADGAASRFASTYGRNRAAARHDPAVAGILNDFQMGVDV